MKTIKTQRFFNYRKNKKTIRKVYQSISLLLFLNFIIACECTYDYRFSIKNESLNEIEVQLYGGYSNKLSDTIKILEGDSLLVFSDNDYWPGGCPGPEKEDFFYVIDSLKIISSDTIQSTTDFMDLSNWLYYPFENGRFDTQGAEFVLMVNEEDFE